METISIIGVGYVGLPLAVEFSNFYKVTGFDLNPSRIEELNNFSDSTGEVETEDLKSADNLNFSFKTEFASNTINCFINNDAFLKKENKEKNEILLKINNLAKGNRYRINCTHIDQNKQIYWFGKMIKRLN